MNANGFNSWMSIFVDCECDFCEKKTKYFVVASNAFRRRYVALCYSHHKEWERGQLNI